MIVGSLLEGGHRLQSPAAVAAMAADNEARVSHFPLVQRAVHRHHLNHTVTSSSYKYT